MVLTDDDEVRTLNRGYRRVDATTDVLSFAQLARRQARGAAAGSLLGDVVVSVEQAARQAPDGVLLDEILRLLAHGLCHLLGFDHQDDEQEKEMFSEESRLLESLGLTPLRPRTYPRIGASNESYRSRKSDLSEDR